MKEHESRILNEGEFYYLILNYFDRELVKYRFKKKGLKNEVFYVDSNNFLHNLNGKATKNNYYIHGEKINNKEGHFIINRLKMLSEIEE